MPDEWHATCWAVRHPTAYLVPRVGAERPSWARGDQTEMCPPRDRLQTLKRSRTGVEPRLKTVDIARVTCYVTSV